MHILPVTEAELKAYLASLPVDDEPLSADELAAVDEALAAADRGDVVSAAEIARIVGEADPLSAE